jgi:hypothetical protein
MSKLLRLGEIKKGKKNACLQTTTIPHPLSLYRDFGEQTLLLHCKTQTKKKNGNPRESYTSCLPRVMR